MTQYRRSEPSQAAIVAARLATDHPGTFSAYRIAADVATILAYQPGEAKQ